MKKVDSTCLKIVAVAIFLLCLFNINHVHAQLSGAVYKDFDSNGKRTLPNEIGVRNVLVSAFVGSNATPVTTRTNIDGNYTFSVSDVPAGSKVRIEFTELGISHSGKKGLDSGTSVQFVTGGSSNVNLGIISSEDYCSLDGLELFASCYVNGDPLAGGTAGEDASLVLFPYTATGLAGVGAAPYPTMVAKSKEIGAVWGTDYQRSTKTAIVSAIVRRHSGLGPLGTGGIYKIDFNTNVVSPLVDLKALGIDTGPDPHVGLPADMEVANEDSLTIHAVAKTGIGGISLSKDEKTLYVVNLYDRKVYSFFIGKPASTPNISTVKSFPIPDPCGDGDFRPWAIKQYGGKIYVGVVCTAETSQDSTKLKSVIYQLDPATGSFTNFFEFPMNYKKGPLDHTGDCINYRYWKPWIDKFPEGCASFFDGTHTVNFAMYPSAILTDIEFDGDGSMIVGFMDRHGLMAGFRNMRPKDDGERYDGFVGGDILRIYNDNGTYKLENNGVAGNRTGSGVGNDQGPGGGEFYGNDFWKFYGNPAHSEITNGGMMIIPGTGEIVASSMDPVDEVYQSAGMRVFSNFDGTMQRGYALYSNKVGTLGKSGGAGDFKAACSSAPIEIGNRVWYDKDFDGVQDPDEEGVDDVKVTLHDMKNGGIEVGSFITKAGGVYCFADSNVIGGIIPENPYEVRLHLKQSTLSSNKFFNGSPKDKITGNESDLRDSDADMVGEYLIIPYTTGLDGETNHAIDFGLIKCIPPNAENDLVFCEPAVTEQLPPATLDNRWKFLSGPAQAQVDSLTGKITNLTANGTYKFMLYYSPAGLACSDTVSVKRNAQPIAISKIGANAICFPIDTTTLSVTPSGGTWRALATNPSAATISSTGKVSGMTKIGFYEYVYKTIEGCEDTAKVEIKACCIKPNAGADLAFCQPTTTYDFPDASTYNRWAIISGPSMASIDSLSGKVTGMSSAGVYKFLLYYSPSGISCSDTVQILIKEKPNAGIDKTGINALCAPISNYQLSGTPTGGVWAASSSNTEVVNVSNTGLITSITKAGSYEFIYLLAGCSDTLKIEIKDCALSSLGDFAWYDLNKNGIQDNRFSPFGVNLGKELPAKGIVMELHKADGTLVGKDTTDINGYYHFNKLLPDSYYVKFDPASYPDVDYAVTIKDGGLNDSLDSDIERVVYKSANFSLALGQHDPTRDIGFFKASKSSIGDPCTCHDIVYDPDEPYEVLDEVIVESTPGGVWAIIEQTGMQKIDTLDNYDIPIGTLLTPDPNKLGRYYFKFAHDVGVGYSVKVTNGVDTLSIANMCNVPALFTNVPRDTICAFDDPITLRGKMLLNNADVTNGVVKFFIVKGFENYGLTGNPIYTEITEFNPRNFAPGDTIDIIAEYKPNITTQCPVKKWYRFVLAIDPTCLSQVGDFVWEDVNKNGIQNAGEKGIQNVSVTLLDKNGVVVTKDAYGNSLLGKTTDANGFYEFINLPPGDYMVKFGNSTTYTTTVKDTVTATDTNDSDADPITGISQKVTLAKGQRNATIDAGFYLTCVPPTNVTANSNSPIVEGNPINLSANSIGGVSYLWTGPNGFTSTLQNPTIPSAASYMSGTYTVTVESSVKNCSSSASIIISINSVCRPNCVPVRSKKIR